jgi:hypothetical protein
VFLLLLSSLLAALTMPAFAQDPAPGELIIHYNAELAVGFTFPYLAILTPGGTTRNIENAPPEGDILLAPSCGRRNSALGRPARQSLNLNDR